MPIGFWDGGVSQSWRLFPRLRCDANNELRFTRVAAGGPAEKSLLRILGSTQKGRTDRASGGGPHGLG